MIGARVFVVRHGNTFEAGEPARRIGIRTDLPLTAAGEAQAVRVGRHLASLGVRPARILCGRLARTRTTAERIADELATAARPVAVDWLDEIDHGPDENEVEAAVTERVGHPALVEWDRCGRVPDGWIVNVPARIAAWHRLYDELRSSGETIVTVTSNGAARFALLADPALSAAGTGRMRLRTGAYGEIRIDPDGLTLRNWDVRPD